MKKRLLRCALGLALLAGAGVALADESIRHYPVVVGPYSAPPPPAGTVSAPYAPVSSEAPQRAPDSPLPTPTGPGSPLRAPDSSSAVPAGPGSLQRAPGSPLPTPPGTPGAGSSATPPAAGGAGTGTTHASPPSAGASGPGGCPDGAPAKHSWLSRCFQCQSCGHPGPHTCVLEPDKRTLTHNEYCCKTRVICIPTCPHCKDTGCDGCQDGCCGRTREVRVMIKKIRKEECEVLKCKAKPIPCADACPAGCPDGAPVPGPAGLPPPAGKAPPGATSPPAIGTAPIAPAVPPGTYPSPTPTELPPPTMPPAVQPRY